MEYIPLGQKTSYPDTYDADLLCGIPRALSRKEWLEDANYDHQGFDVWTANEVSWLDEAGKPRTAVAQWLMPVASTHLIESKSCKLYLNGFNQTRMSEDEVLSHLNEDFSKCAGLPIEVKLYTLAEFEQCRAPEQGICLDDLSIECDEYHINPSLLKRQGGHRVEERLYTTLFRSNCLVTHQPDWANIYIDYKGPAMDHSALLKYLVSYRMHQGFHECCIEMITYHLQEYFDCEALVVEGRFTRRGGIDIHPVRSIGPVDFLPFLRQFRQ